MSNAAINLVAEQFDDIEQQHEQRLLNLAARAGVLWTYILLALTVAS